MFAVVAPDTEAQKVRAFLRYADTDNGWQKLDTLQANALLASQYPHYLYYSPQLDAHCHGVHIDNIRQHYQPRQRLQELVRNTQTDLVLQDCQYLAQLLQECHLKLQDFGVTGSLLIGAQNPASDIDLIIYSVDVFQQARHAIQQLMSQNVLQELSVEDWFAAYQRRDCDLSFDEYVWHEKRKHNKFMLRGRKVDLSLLTTTPAQSAQPCRKLGAFHTRCQVVDAERAYHYPAEYSINLPEIAKILCFTATYIGQALAGEWIEVSGQLEINAEGEQVIVVGSNREARGEYIKVVTDG